MDSLSLFAFLPAAIAAPQFNLQYLAQDVLAPAPSNRYSAPIKSWNNVFHVVNITVGTPPQLFNVTLDLEDSGFIIPSTKCKFCRSDGFNHLYNESESSTSEPDGSTGALEWWGDRFTGLLARDTVRINNVEISNQTFLTWNELRGFAWPAMYEGFDGILRLGPPWSSGQHRRFNITYPPYLQTLQSEGILEKNIFSLDFPRGLDDEGEFTLGGTNPERYTGEIRKVKVLNESELAPELQSSWNVPISSIRFNTSHPIRVDLPHGNAKLSSNPMFILPQDFADTFVKVIGGRGYQPYMYNIPCSRRAYLPELTFTIGGHELTISAFDYAWEFSQPFGFAPTCMVWIVGNVDAFLPRDTVVLGTPFLRGFYNVWDFENREVGFADLKR